LLAENLTNAATGTRDRRRFGIIEIRYRTAGRVGRRSEFNERLWACVA
jgi:hypothetical protein